MTLPASSTDATKHTSRPPARAISCASSARTPGRMRSMDMGCWNSSGSARESRVQQQLRILSDRTEIANHAIARTGSRIDIRSPALDDFGDDGGNVLGAL